MKIRKRTNDPDRPYDNYRTLREHRARASRGDCTESFASEPTRSEVEAFGPEDADAMLVNALYHEYRLRNCSVDELSEIRERVIASTLAQLDQPRPQSVFGLPQVRWQGWIGQWARPLATSAGTIAAIAVSAALVFSAARSDVDLAALSRTLPVSIPVLDRASELLAASDLTYGVAEPSISRRANVFALGAGALNLALALESRNPEHTRAAGRAMAVVYAAEKLLSLSERASDIVRISPESGSYSRSVVRRSVELLVTTQASLKDEEIFLYELGQWVEAVYLSSHAVRAATHAETLAELLIQAQRRFDPAGPVATLDSDLAERVKQLASIDPGDGLGDDEIELARVLSAEIKSMVN